MQYFYLVSDVSGEQHPHSSAPCWTMDLQLVLGIVGQTVDILHWALLPIPTTAHGTQGTTHVLDSLL